MPDSTRPNTMAQERSHGSGEFLQEGRHPPASSGEISSAEVTSAYRRYAPVYDWVFGAVLEPGRRSLADAVQAEKPGTLLEVGVGTGLMLARYPADTAVVGIDLSQEMLSKAQVRAQQTPKRSIRLVCSNAETLDFADDTFDCVTLPYVLSVTPDPDRLLRESMRVCRSGGAVFVLNHFSGSRSWWLLEQAVRPLAARVGFKSEFSLQERVFDLGYAAESVRTVNMFGLSRLVVLRKP